jgi:hypothetical protein
MTELIARIEADGSFIDTAINTVLPAPPPLHATDDIALQHSVNERLAG